MPLVNKQIILQIIITIKATQGGVITHPTSILIFMTIGAVALAGAGTVRGYGIMDGTIHGCGVAAGVGTIHGAGIVGVGTPVGAGVGTPALDGASQVILVGAVIMVITGADHFIMASIIEIMLLIEPDEDIVLVALPVLLYAEDQTVPSQEIALPTAEYGQIVADQISIEAVPLEDLVL